MQMIGSIPRRMRCISEKLTDVFIPVYLVSTPNILPEACCLPPTTCYYTTLHIYNLLALDIYVS